MAEINFDTNKEDTKLIVKIAHRAGSIKAWQNRQIDTMDLSFVLAAVHLNGCPLDLQKLLDAPQADFTHDILGMLQHINRDDGSLNDFFDPRCSLPEVSDDSIN
jgi:hypothetical protein